MNKKENNIITFIKGFIIGLGIIFPISASVLAISLGIYKKLLKVINNFSRYLKKEPGFIMFFSLGVILSIIISSLSLDYLLSHFPIITLLFFIGLVSGGVPSLYKKIKNNINFNNILLSIIGIIIIVIISIINSNSVAYIDLSIISLCKLFLIGLFGAGAMIIPGVSGSVILIIFGYYEPILNIITVFFKGINIFNNFVILLVFSIGMILGIILFSKIINYFLDKYEIKSYFLIIGFVIASLFRVLLMILDYKFNIVHLIIGIIFYIIGLLVPLKYLKE